MKFCKVWLLLSSSASGVMSCIAKANMRLSSNGTLRCVSTIYTYHCYGNQADNGVNSAIAIS